MKIRAPVPPQKRFLERALAEAARRFGGRAGLVGFGVGRRYCESEEAFGRRSRGYGGLCLKVYVAKKLPGHRLSAAERLPRSMAVPPTGRARIRRISIDVVARPALELQTVYGHTWPTGDGAGGLQPGRLFVAADRRPASGTLLQNAQGELGTVAGLISLGGEIRAVTAAHVFVSPCAPSAGIGTATRALGVSGRTWVALDDRFHPRTPWRSFQGVNHFRDGTCFIVPPVAVPPEAGVQWPTGFTRRLSTEDEIEGALKSSRTDECFIWVERHGSQQRLAAALESWIPGGSPMQLTCIVPYGLLYSLRFSSEQERPVKGDSGAGVYLSDVDGGCSLFGIHVVSVITDSPTGGITYATPITHPLSAANMDLSANCRFYG